MKKSAKFMVMKKEKEKIFTEEFTDFDESEI